MVVFITCGKKKRHERCKAEDMYIGTYFRMTLAYAKSLLPRKIYILSAKYGVTELDDVISPYNFTLNKISKHKRKLWAWNCYKQLQRKKIDFNEETIWLGGRAYWEHLVQAFPNVQIPFAHKPIGAQKHFIKERLRKCTQ